MHILVQLTGADKDGRNARKGLNGLSEKTILEDAAAKLGIKKSISSRAMKRRAYKFVGDRIYTNESNHEV